MSLVSTEVVSTTDVAEICVLGSVVPGVTVSTVDCVLDGTTGAADGNETDINEEVSVVTGAAAAATLGSAIILEAAMGADVVTVADVGVIKNVERGLREEIRGWLYSSRTTQVRRHVGSRRRDERERCTAGERLIEHDRY